MGLIVLLRNWVVQQKSRYTLFVVFPCPFQQEVSMASGYLENSQQEAQEIAHALQQIDALLGNEKLGRVYQGDVVEVRQAARVFRSSDVHHRG
ncbi:MAG: hypothetical protein ACP5QU_07875 [Anaerolineae bacterium]